MRADDARLGARPGERVAVDPEELGRRFYGFLTSVVVPRPIAWVSTRSAEGVDNLAPHSFFTVASTDPPIVQFTSVGRKDTLRNVESTRAFVVNVASADLMAQVNATATDFGPAESEFDHVGVTRQPSLRVAPPRVAESPVALECELHALVATGRCTVVLGRVVHAAVDPAVMRDGSVEIDLLRPLARLGGDEWGELGTIRETTRIRRADWPGHYADPPERHG